MSTNSSQSPQQSPQNPQSSQSSKKKRKRERRDARRDHRDQASRAALTPEEARAELMEGVTVDTLIALGVLTARGGASPSARRKVKQVNHLLNLIKPALTDLFERHEDPIIIDMGAGRATVSLALYDRWIRPRGRGRLIAVESRPELVEKVRASVGDRYPRLEVISGEALTAPLPERAHLMLGLHACDLATDHAIARAITSRADYVALVPCCQAEVARSLKESPKSSALWSAAHHRREFGAHLTNVSRTLALRAVGYAMSVTELTGWEHSMKNELLLGRRVARFHKGARAELNALMSEVGLASLQEDEGGGEGTLIHSSITPWLIRELEALCQERDQRVAEPEPAPEPAPET